MSTRSIVGTITRTGNFQGRYVHSDGYPTGRGPVLSEIIARCDGNLRYVVDTIKGRKGGWSYLDANYAENFLGAERADHVTGFGLAYADNDPMPLMRGNVNDRHSESGMIEWGYFFTSRDETKAELVVIEFGFEVQREVARVKVTELHKMTELDWAKIECGEHFERCGHYAWFHFPELRDQLGNLGTATFVGAEPLTPRDATQAVYQGRTLQVTGSGHSGGGYMGGRQGLWYGTLRDPQTGETVEAPLYRTNSKTQPGGMAAISTTELVYPDLDALRDRAGIA